MRKAIIFLICITFVLLITSCSKSPQKATESTAQNQTEVTTAEIIETAQLYNKYLSIIKEYEEAYGTITEERKGEYSNDVSGGVSCYTLIDFNADGCEELLIVFDNNTPENNLNGALTLHVYSYTGISVEQVHSQELQISERHKLEGDYLWLALQEDKTYLVENISYEQDGKSFGGYSYSSFNGKEFTRLFETACTEAESNPEYYINGKTCTQQEFIEKNQTVTRKYLKFPKESIEAHKEQNQFTLEVLKDGKVQEPSAEK